VDFNGWNGSTSVMHLLWEAAPEPNQVADISRILSKYVVDLQAHIQGKLTSLDYLYVLYIWKGRSSTTEYFYTTRKKFISKRNEKYCTCEVATVNNCEFWIEDVQ
jgi:hypothetical protein